MSTQHVRETVDRPVGLHGLSGVDRWVLVPIVVGIVFAAVQLVHTFQMVYYGSLGVALEALLPFGLAAMVAVTGPWLYRQGYRPDERRRMIAWMTMVAILVGLLFAWALSHQFILGYVFPHANYVMTTNLIAGSLLGLVVGIYDVTSRRRRQAVEAERETVAQQHTRLSVLNRVLRHNLRNDLNAVAGYAELLEDEPAESAEYLSQIQVLASGLVTIGEKAREIEQVVATQREDRPAPLSTVVQRAVEAVETTAPGCEIKVGTVVDDAVNGAVLTPVLRELIENACRHNDREQPQVAVETSYEAENDAITIVVADNGPGIPEHELVPIDTGVETALEHGSGLGLWLVEWGVAALNGDIRFAENDPRGTRVTLRVHPVPDPVQS